MNYPAMKTERSIHMNTVLQTKGLCKTYIVNKRQNNVLKNIDYVNEPMDENLVTKVQEIIGDQMFVRWKNS